MRPGLDAALLDESGQWAIPMVIGLMLVVAFFALSLDAGVWYFDHRTAQNQVDAAALAAIVDLPSSDTSAAELAAKDWLKNNKVAAGVADGATVVHVPDSNVASGCQSPALSPGQARIVFGKSGFDERYDIARVCVRRNSLVVFGQLAGLTNAVVSAGATAAVLHEVTPFSLMAMNPSACRSMVFGGNAIVEIKADTGGDGGSTYTKSSCTSGDRAFRVDGSNARVIAEGGGDHIVVGGQAGCNVIQCVPTPLTGQPLILPDPWGCSGGSCVPTPSVSSGTGCVPAATRITGSPPHLPALSAGQAYCEFTRSDALKLDGGVYVFKGDFLVNGGSSVKLYSDPGVETLIYMTCVSTPCSGGNKAGAFKSEGQSQVVLKGHSDFNHILVFVDRQSALSGSCNPNADDPKVSIAGQGINVLDGNIYAIRSLVYMGGNGGADIKLNGSIVADRICFKGNATYEVQWDAVSAAVVLPPALVD